MIFNITIIWQSLWLKIATKSGNTRPNRKTINNNNYNKLTFCVHLFECIFSVVTCKKGPPRYHTSKDYG